MVEMTASVDGAASAAFNAALKELAESLGNQSATAPRRAAIQICKNFRKATKTSPRYARPDEFEIQKASGSPRWVSSIDGARLDPVKHLVLVDRSKVWRGKKEIYVKSGKLRKGGVSVDKAREAREVRKHLFLFNRGFAKWSWGIVMHNIFIGADPGKNWPTYKRKRADRPEDVARGSMSSSEKTQMHASGVARIVNRLGYIESAMTANVNEVVSKAANIIYATLSMRKMRKSMAGHSPDEIKAAAREMAHEFKQRFAD